MLIQFDRRISKLSMTEFETASFSSSSSSSNHPWKYHVFLSFRGEDTRNSFTGHLCSALRQKGITTFMDDELTRGEDITTALLQAIEESKITIIVFSENYASSKWCLDELVKILECKKSKHQIVRPVFYKVNPSDIRNHRGSFRVALANHKSKFKDNLDKVEIWKNALSEAANLSGWPLSNEHSEPKLIHDIVEEISEQIMKHTYMNVAKYPVGIEPRLQDINRLLARAGVEGRNVCMVGIWGIGGIGKTTIAKAVYNSIAHKFEGSCFLENVRENSACTEGVVKQQKTLLFEILGRKKMKLTNTAIGITTIKDRLSNKKVLLVFDDVSNLNQVNNLAGRLDWFGKGSVIIITTRYKRLLVSHGIDLIYNVKALDYKEAVELFSWHAFKRKEPLQAYVKLTERAISYAQFLPLALRVLGSYLYGENIDTWKSALDGFKSPEIQEILRTSYDALVDSAKEVFLDIACFFNGESREYVKEMLQGCSFNPNNCINVLIEMALINIDETNRIRMHDLLEELGKDIVHLESPYNPGERSRLWFHDDVYSVLTENTGTAKITGIKVNLPEESDVIHLSGTTFSKMRNLKLFIHRAGCFSGVLDYLPNSLRVVDWPDCPFQSLPSNFNARKLAVFKMPGSRITGLMGGFKNLTNLTSINLSNCQHLIKVSDLSQVPNLKTLDLDCCESLIEVHSSVGLLDKLTRLDLSGCSSLTIIPTTVSWKSMKQLEFAFCRCLENFVEIVDKLDCVLRLRLNRTSIKQLPSWIGYLTSLIELDVSKTPIKTVPSSIGYLSRLEILRLESCENLTEVPHSIYGLQHLRYLNLSRCPKLVMFPNNASSEVPSLPLFPRLHNLEFEGCRLISLTDFLASLDCISTLEHLNLSRSNLASLPACITKFVVLRHLWLQDCKSLREIPELPKYIELIAVSGCISLEKFPALSRMLEFNDTQFLKCMDLSHCHRLLVDNMGFDVVPKGEDSSAKLNQIVSNIADALVVTQVHKESPFAIILPGSEVPKWLDFQKIGVCALLGIDTVDDICEFLIAIPRTLKWEETGLLVCAVFESTEDCSDYCLFGLRITINGVNMDFNEGDEINDCFFTEIVTEMSAHVWLKYIPLKVGIKEEVDRKSDPWIPYLCRISFIYHGDSEVEGYLFKSCGVHLANVPYNDDGDDYYDCNDVSRENISELGLICHFC